ncbi:T9SS type A sorting domain-containing protein [Lutibacter sp. A64]|uniref:T9SS type A sorting domain-containing protein n=1 Tax=Lutibacter sp. A64 TaxID=2918526 RepID=UPI001F057A7A|nr:T9SS type A sorting domain-containing protein [Lutibacter sp. A64]UMB53429.1 T9SS type A sorting domain-containing protein [Lutibacter sp. A64]
MKPLIKKVCFFTFFLITSLFYGQDLTIAGTESITIKNGATLYVNGLALTPSSDFTINGENAITKTSTALSEESIERVFTFDSFASGFQGELILFYEDTELNSLTEADLVLQVKNGLNIWNSYTGTLNTSLNTLTFTFGSATDFSSITASSTGATLAIKDFAKLNLQIYPNPVINNVYINTTLDIEINVYNAIGQMVLKTQEKLIDISRLARGSYFFVIKDISTNAFNSYQIVKI